MKRILCAALLLVLLLGLTGCKKKEPEAPKPNPVATITMEDGSVMNFELILSAAPNTVANFTSLANSGFYDGLDFYRVVAGVLIQSGDPNADGTGHAGYTIKGEFSLNGIQNDLPHNRGTLSMCRLEDTYNSASSQFFILQGSYPEYNGKYAAFGVAMDEATLNVIDSIASQPVDSYNLPLRRQYIRTIRVNTHGNDLPLETIPMEEEE